MKRKSAGRKRYARKYISKRKAVRSAKKSNFARAVKAVLSKQSETKESYFNSGNSLTMFNGEITAVGDLLQIVPNVANSVEDNGRIGQSVRAKSLNIRGHMKLNINDVTDSTRLPSVMARLMVVSMKTAPNFNEAQAQGPKLGTLLKKGGTTTSFNGALQDLHAPINTDVFTVHYDKKFYLSQSYLNATGVSPPSTIIAQDTKDTVKFFNINIKCKDKVLKYDEDVSSDLLPTNFAPFMLLGYSYLDGSVGDSIFTNLGLQYITTMRYQDI